MQQLFLKALVGENVRHVITAEFTFCHKKKGILAVQFSPSVLVRKLSGVWPRQSSFYMRGLLSIATSSQATVATQICLPQRGL